MADTVYKVEQIYALANGLNISQASVKRVIDLYLDRLRHRLLSGESVKFLNVCYIVVGGNKDSYYETLAYISTEISKETNLGKDVVLRVLKNFEELIITDVRRFYTYVVRGLVSIKCEEYRNNVYKLRLNKSDYFSNMDIRVMAVPAFKRKVESYYDRKNA